MIKDILKYLPNEICESLEKTNSKHIEEIRIRVNKPVIIKTSENEEVLNYYISSEKILNIVQSICDNSIYSYQNQICNGFITLNGGNRVGITGTSVYKDGQVSNIYNISSLNFRIANEVDGASNDALKYILDLENNSVYNTLIVSPPGAGKTTIIRDIIKNISNGIPKINFSGLTVGVVDERCEIAAVSKGVPQNDIGIRTDVIDNINKIDGIKILVRSMSPKVIVADEIGNKNETDIINYAICSGVKGIFTAHGSSIEELNKNSELKRMFEYKLFDRILFLNEIEKGKIKKCIEI